jgi:hypothetical protein
MPDRQYTLTITLDDDINEYRACCFLLGQAIQECARRVPEESLEFAYYLQGYGLVQMADHQVEDDDPLDCENSDDCRLPA